MTSKYFDLERIESPKTHAKDPLGDFGHLYAGLMKKKYAPSTYPIYCVDNITYEDNPTSKRIREQYPDGISSDDANGILCVGAQGYIILDKYDSKNGMAVLVEMRPGEDPLVTTCFILEGRHEVKINSFEGQQLREMMLEAQRVVVMYVAGMAMTHTQAVIDVPQAMKRNKNGQMVKDVKFRPYRRVIFLDPESPRYRYAKTEGDGSKKTAHPRRGHIRTYETGKRVWVRPCWVGPPTVEYEGHIYIIKQPKGEQKC